MCVFCGAALTGAGLRVSRPRGWRAGWPWLLVLCRRTQNTLVDADDSTVLTGRAGRRLKGVGGRGHGDGGSWALGGSAPRDARTASCRIVPDTGAQAPEPPRRPAVLPRRPHACPPQALPSPGGLGGGAWLPGPRWALRADGGGRSPERHLPIGTAVWPLSHPPAQAGTAEWDEAGKGQLEAVRAWGFLHVTACSASAAASPLHSGGPSALGFPPGCFRTRSCQRGCSPSGAREVTASRR